MNFVCVLTPSFTLSRCNTSLFGFQVFVSFARYPYNTCQTSQQTAFQASPACTCGPLVGGANKSTHAQLQHSCKIVRCSRKGSRCNSGANALGCILHTRPLLRLRP